MFWDVTMFGTLKISNAVVFKFVVTFAFSSNSTSTAFLLVSTVVGVQIQPTATVW